MSYITKDFPIERLNEVALKEANAKKPIYQIHKWWARRLGSIFRMIILTTFLPSDISEYELWRKFYQKMEFPDKIILDPFMGGGTTVVEALKLGCKVIGVDIHPVAWFVTKKEIDPLNLDRFKEEFDKLDERVADKIKKYYKTLCPKCGQEVDAIYIFWVKKIKCLRCGNEVPLFRSFKMASLSNKLHVVFCPACKEIIETEEVSKEITCPNCENKFIPSRGYTDGKHYFCPCGDKSEVLRSVRRQGKIPNAEIYAVEYYCPYCGERGYKKADEYDHKLFLMAKEEFEQREKELLIPKQELPDGYNTRQAKNFNYKYFHEMFNERQLLCLSMLLKDILKIEDENVKEFMILAFSDCINSNNMFCIYNKSRREAEPLFGLHAYYPKNQPVENNVWGAKYGYRTFIKCANKVLRAKRYMQYPYEIRNKSNKIIVNEGVKGVQVKDFDELSRGEGNVILRCGTSEDLSIIPDKSIDAVITDPPYYDNVMYSEIADFFYVWQRLALKEIYEYYEGEYSPRAREIIKNEVQGKDDEFYLHGLTRIFKECNRVLKDDGLMIFTFHHEKSKAWASTLKSILEAYEEKWPRLIIDAIYAIRSEGEAEVHGKGIRYDIIIVCRKTFEEPERISWETLKDRIHDRAKEVLERLWLSGRDLRDEDMFVVTMGKCLELYSRHYPNIFKNGRQVKVEEAVSNIDDIIDSLLKIKDIEALPGAIDEMTKIYCSYLMGLDNIGYDSLHKRLSKGGIEIGTFMKENLIEKTGNSVKILSPQERKSYIEEKIRKGQVLSTIDKVHLIYVVYAEGKPILKYLSEYGGEDVKKVSELIYKKTGDEIYAKIAGVATTIPKKVKPTTLEEFIGED